MSAPGASPGSAPREWDAGSYHRVSTPQQQMAVAVLERLPLRGDEVVLDAGCGSGRISEMLLDRLPDGKVIAVDASEKMVERARDHLAGFGERASVQVADLTALAGPESLDLDAPVDAVLSTATFHWIADHDALFAALASVLRPGGRLVAQCGGRGNIDSARGVVATVQAQAPYAAHFAGWEPPWHYASPEDTTERLERAGFVEVDCRLRPWPVVPDDPEEFLRTVIIAPHLDQLPPSLHDPFVADVLEAFAATESGQVELDYVRLDIDALSS
ncbi:MAG: methyltransferase domain-containing protein [Acidimicrobiia bacterium]|nr:methyltransferase domain-containing protein [Acidimicrobiia bacterium]